MSTDLVPISEYLSRCASFKKLDKADGKEDQQIKLDSLPKDPKKSFYRLDTNHDNRITLQEILLQWQKDNPLSKFFAILTKSGWEEKRKNILFEKLLQAAKGETGKLNSLATELVSMLTCQKYGLATLSNIDIIPDQLLQKMAIKDVFNLLMFLPLIYSEAKLNAAIKQLSGQNKDLPEEEVKKAVYQGLQKEIESFLLITANINTKEQREMVVALLIYDITLNFACKTAGSLTQEQLSLASDYYDKLISDFTISVPTEKRTETENQKEIHKMIYIKFALFVRAIREFKNLPQFQLDVCKRIVIEQQEVEPNDIIKSLIAATKAIKNKHQAKILLDLPTEQMQSHELTLIWCDTVEFISRSEQAAVFLELWKTGLLVPNTPSYKNWKNFFSKINSQEIEKQLVSLIKECPKALNQIDLSPWNKLLLVLDTQSHQKLQEWLLKISRQELGKELAGIIEKTTIIVNQPGQEETFRALWQNELIALDNPSYKEWRQWVAKINSHELGKQLASLIEQGVVNGKNKDEWLTRLSKKISWANFKCSISANLNQKEKDILVNLERLAKQGLAREILRYVARINNEDIKKEEGFKGDNNTIAKSINWGEIFLCLTRSHPELEKQLAAQLEKDLKGLDHKNSNAVKSFCKSIPTRSTLDTLLKGKEAKKLRNIIKQNWKLIRPLLGHIFYVEDKGIYRQQLEQQLKQQGIEWNTLGATTSFQASVSIIDLNSMTKYEYPARFEILDSKSVLITLNKKDEVVVFIVNTNDPVSLKKLAAGLLPKDKGDENYLVFYFPRIEFQQGKHCKINMEYGSTEGIAENLILKGDKKDLKKDTSKALKIFMAAASKEDGYMEESNRVFSEFIKSYPVSKIKTEPIIGFEKIFDLIGKMDSDSKPEEIQKVFLSHLSKQQAKNLYEKYKKSIYDILIRSRNISREEFLCKVIEACDGQAMLASAIAYDILHKMGTMYSNNLLILYPNTFKPIDGVKDRAGAIYHFIGCFFASYALQRCLVERYYSDSAFAKKIDEKLKSYSKELSQNMDLKNGTIKGMDSFDFKRKLLLLVQFAFLKEGNQKMREVTSLAGIFKEEVVEDADTSPEVFHDEMGRAAGLAFYATVSGNPLSKSNEKENSWFDNNDNRFRLFLELLRFQAEPEALSKPKKLALQYFVYSLADYSSSFKDSLKKAWSVFK